MLCILLFKMCFLLAIAITIFELTLYFHVLGASAPPPSGGPPPGGDAAQKDVDRPPSPPPLSDMDQVQGYESVSFHGMTKGSRDGGHATPIYHNAYRYPYSWREGL